MIYVKIGGNLYPATVEGLVDREWDDRMTKAITLETDYATAHSLFVDGAAWSIVQRHENPVYQLNEDGSYAVDENGDFIQIDTAAYNHEWDNSEYSRAGAITDHRDGTVTVVMGKLTQVEELEAKLANAITAAELAAAYEEGVNRA